MFNMKLFAGNSIPILSQKIAHALYMNLGNIFVGKFSDGEISVQINENVRGDDIYIIQSTCYPTNDNLIELIIMIDAFKRASAGRITAIIPYFGYSRQDRRICSARVPITAKVIAEFLSNVGVNRILTVDLHAEQIQGFFNIPVDNILSNSIFLQDIYKKKLENPIVVSPDIGGVVRARTLAEKLFSGTDIAIIDKRRPKPNVTEIMNVIGDINNRDCILVDDIIDTGGTLCQAANILKQNNAKHVYAYITHPIFSGNVINNINNSLIDEIIVCDSIPLSKQIKKLNNIKTLTLSMTLAEAIRRLNNEESLSMMFKKNISE
ncbi:ribose-phosphate pyrophosphokinase [Enterobacteriaceae endosymbiont of Neohaemonia nigricornis]|uniref:ribose-phosphate pyrophosphokinase n=1 Tax=Enterobacteriaceae endosymbiont of Neohaemonia nigricornis TaxID=2675792 RepID=UPI001448F8DC|nr:ribose-phosphate pyrophosphokinase [Enterobacteriaceae endosymbiont of Neohaemonia nigricornis]QJC30302.1 ribose-phosphate diphosphokinase [Enterobacteriaceae endosymbiont of Neohaemonia nigricornis]